MLYMHKQFSVFSLSPTTYCSYYCCPDPYSSDSECLPPLYETLLPLLRSAFLPLPTRNLGVMHMCFEFDCLADCYIVDSDLKAKKGCIFSSRSSTSGLPSGMQNNRAMCWSNYHLDYFLHLSTVQFFMISTPTWLLHLCIFVYNIRIVSIVACGTVPNGSSDLNALIYNYGQVLTNWVHVSQVFSDKEPLGGPEAI